MLIQEFSACFNPFSRVATIRYNTQQFPIDMLLVQRCNIVEGDEAILEAPVSSVSPARANVVDFNCTCTQIE